MSGLGHARFDPVLGTCNKTGLSAGRPCYKFLLSFAKLVGSATLLVGFHGPDGASGLVPDGRMFVRHEVGRYIRPRRWPSCLTRSARLDRKVSCRRKLRIAHEPRFQENELSTRPEVGFHIAEPPPFQSLPLIQRTGPF